MDNMIIAVSTKEHAHTMLAQLRWIDKLMLNELQAKKVQDSFSYVE